MEMRMMSQAGVLPRLGRISLLTIVLSLLVPLATSVVELPQWGWDFQVYRQSSERWLNGLDPFDLGDSSLCFFYPPLFLKFYSLISIPWNLYVTIIIVIFAASVLLLVIRFGQHVLFMTGFLSSHMAIFSGNFAAIEFVLFGACLFAVAECRYMVAGFLFSIIVAAKITPVFLLPGILLLLPREAWPSSLKGLFLGAALIFLVSFYFWPNIFKSYMLSLVLPSGQRMAILSDSVSPFNFLLQLWGSPPLPVAVVYVLNFMLLIVLSLIMAAEKIRVKLSGHSIAICSLLFFLSPRLMDYSMFYGGGIIALVSSRTKLSERREWLLTLMVFVLPEMLFYVKRSLLGYPPNTWVRGLLETFNGGIWILAMAVLFQAAHKRKGKRTGIS